MRQRPGATGSGAGAVNFTVEPNTGNYRSATINIAGRAVLIEQAGHTATCLAKPIKAGETVSGLLDPNYCPSRALRDQGYRAASYSFSGKQGDQIAVLKVSTAGSIYLSLLDSRGQLIAQTFDGRLPSSGYLLLPATGDYVIEVAAFNLTIYTVLLVSPEAGCDFSITPVSRTFEASGGKGSVDVLMEVARPDRSTPVRQSPRRGTNPTAAAITFSPRIRLTSTPSTPTRASAS